MNKKKSTFQDALMLTDKGYRDLKKAIAACTLTNFSMFIPAMVMLQVVMELLKPFTGGSISWTNMWIYFGLGIIGAVIVFLCNKNDYKKTYVASYMESENTRIALAEHIRKLPMSVFNSKNLSELTTNLMGDVATSEHVLSHVYPQIISNVITITVVCIMFAFYDWRMALAIFISVPVAFLIIFASRRIQERLGKKHAQAKLEASELLLSGKIELVPMLLCLLIVTRIYGPIITELTLLPELFYHQIAIRRMRTLMNIQPMEGDTEKPVKEYDIELNNISFRYNPQGEETIKNVNVTIPAGAITALVGPSGSGKSTLSRLIARFWDVSKGKVEIGGIDVKELDPEHLMEYMSFVFQDVVLFNDTVYNNIKIGNMNATEEQVLAAAKAARCDEFIEKMPDGYQTVLGENGSTLSGGERQRLSIARALLKDAPIVLLDEATASLDPESESSIQQAIGRLIQGKTVLVIAHRLRTIAKADKIIVLDDGKVVEQGTHSELMEQNGLYKRLYTIQQESLGWSV